MPENPRDAKRELAWVRGAVRAEGLLAEALAAFRERLLGEAVSCATDALFNWVAKGVEWATADRGAIYLHDSARGRLWALPDTTVGAVRCPDLGLTDPGDSFVADAFAKQEGNFCNRLPSPNRYRDVRRRARSALAMPLLEPGDAERTPLAVYYLEADREGAFSPIQLSEMRRISALLMVDLLVLRDWLADRDRQPWVVHPEVHGWSAGKLLERFCRAVAHPARGEGGRMPACAVWNADELTGRCWALGTCGYDYDFLTRCWLGPESVVARVALADDRRPRRGPPRPLGFCCPRRAERARVEDAAVVPLRGDHFRGTLNLYALGGRPLRLGSDLLRWVGDQAERLLGTLNRQYLEFGRGYLRGLLSRSDFPTPDPGLLIKGLKTVFRAKAVSLWLPQGADLVPADGAVFGRDRSLSQIRCRIHPGPGEEDSQTAYCFRYPGETVRANFGADDPVYRCLVPRLPPPNAALAEMIVVGDAALRRRMRIGLDSRGVISLFRSGKGRPFTQAEAWALKEIAASEKGCLSLFDDWIWGAEHRAAGADYGSRLSRALGAGTNVHSPTTTLVEGKLQRLLRADAENQLPARQASLFFYCEDARPPFRMFVCHPRLQLPLEECAPEPLGDLLGDSGLRYPSKIVEIRGRGGEGARVCVPVMTWYEDRLTEALFVLDLPKADYNRAAVWKAAASIDQVLALNEWQANGAQLANDAQLLDGYGGFACIQDFTEVRSMTLRLDSEPPRGSPGSELVRNHELQKYGVRLNEDGSCVVPLRVGPFLVASASLRFERDLEDELIKAPHHGAADSQEAFRRLRRQVTLLTGAWARVVAPNARIWRVEFGEAVREGNLAVWQERVVRKPDFQETWFFER